MISVAISGAAVAYFVRLEQPAPVEVELLNYRALRSRDALHTYVFTPEDRLRVRVKCAPELAPAACGQGLAATIAGAPAAIESATATAARAVRGEGVILSFAPLGHTSKTGPAQLAVGGQTFAIELFTPLAPVAAKDDNAKAALLDARIKDPSTAPLDVLDAMKERARLYSRQGKLEQYRRTQEARADRALQLGYVTEASDAWSASAYFAYRSRDFEAMESLLDRAEELDRRESLQLGKVRSGLVRGYAARELGRFREALRVLEDAATRAWTYGYDDDHEWVEKALGPLYLELGQPEKALEQLHRLEPHFRAKDERARLAFLADLAWVELETVARGAARGLERPAAHLEEALVLAKKLGAREDEATILTNLVWADQLAGDRTRARARIAELARLPEEAQGFGRLLALVVEGTFSAEERRFDAAVSSFSEAIDRAAREHASPSPYVWRALYGRARAYWMRGDAELAKRDFLAAQAALETLALQADLQTSRARFFDDADALREDAVRFFIELGAFDEAFLAAERARTYVLLSLELQVRSERLGEAERRALTEHRRRHLELRAKLHARAEERKLVQGSALPSFDRETETIAHAASAELGALYEKLDREAPVLTGRIATIDALWDVLPEDAELVGFAKTGSSTVTFVLGRRQVRVETFDPRVPLAKHLHQKGHLYLVAGALSVEQLARDVLPAVLPDRTASILPYAGALLRPLVRSTGAPLVVSDPRSNLPYAREEGLRVARVLPYATLLQGDAATEKAVREKLEGASLFHFAGHGQLAAVDPWQSRLELRDGQLTLENLLITAPSVRTVVLSGCETGRGASLSRGISLGLPEAFSMAGAEHVLATTGRVGDEDAARFIERFYAEGGADHPARAFRSAFLATRAELGARNNFYLMGRADGG